MCGRFVQCGSSRDYARLIGVQRCADELIRRWNVAPSLAVGLVRDGECRTLDLWTWGFVPHWAKDPTALSRPVNARIETVAKKPMFRDAWRRGQRGLIPAEGFYEWRVENGRKQPYYIRRHDGEPLLLAAIWDRWERPGRAPIRSCAVLVGPPNELVASLHERMPVIIPRAAADGWLSPATDPRLLTAIAPCPAHEMEAYKVDGRVNNAANEGPDLIAAL